MSKREEIVKAAFGFRYLDSEAPDTPEQERAGQQEEVQPLGLRNILAMTMRMAYAEEGVMFHEITIRNDQDKGTRVVFTASMGFTEDEMSMILAEGPSGPNTGPVAGGEEVNNDE